MHPIMHPNNKIAHYFHKMATNKFCFKFYFYMETKDRG